MTKDPLPKNALLLNDASFISILLHDSTLTVKILLWNEKIIQILFRGVIKFVFNESDFFRELVIISKSAFMDQALSHRYAAIPSEPTFDFPKDHPYRHFQLLDINDYTALDVISENISYEYMITGDSGFG